MKKLEANDRIVAIYSHFRILFPEVIIGASVVWPHDDIVKRFSDELASQYPQASISYHQDFKMEGPSV